MVSQCQLAIQRPRVYLAYLDDSDTKRKNEKWQVITAVVIPDEAFDALELLASLHIEQLIPADRLERFEEFHAAELYGGYGVFEGIEQPKRFEAIKGLLSLLESLGVSVVYGAVDLTYLAKQPFASADPVDVSFRMCAAGVQDWLANRLVQQVKDGKTGDACHGLFIADDCDSRINNILQKSYRSMRYRMRPPSHEPGKLGQLHDDMYFGDSRYSIGIQLADLCCYFITRHLAQDAEIAGFYSIVEKQIVSSKRLPE